MGWWRKEESFSDYTVLYDPGLQYAVWRLQQEVTRPKERLTYLAQEVWRNWVNNQVLDTFDAVSLLPSLHYRVLFSKILNILWQHFISANGQNIVKQSDNTGCYYNLE